MLQIGIINRLMAEMQVVGNEELQDIDPVRVILDMRDTVSLTLARDTFL